MRTRICGGYRPGSLEFAPGLAGAGGDVDGDGRVEELGIAPEGDGDAAGLEGDLGEDVGDGADALAVEGEDDVAGFRTFS